MTIQPADFDLVAGLLQWGKAMLSIVTIFVGVALAASITVIIASGLGLPVSSTHIAVGGVFGVGLYREFITNRKRKLVKPNALGSDELSGAAAEADEMLMELQAKKIKKSAKRMLVRRQHLTTIATAWIVTVPAAALLAALLFKALDLR